MGEMSEMPIDRGWAWAVAFGACINIFWCLGSFSVSGVIFVEVIDMYETSSTLSSTMFSIFMAANAVAVLIQALLVGHVTERTLGVVAGLCFGLSLMLQFWSPNVYFFLIIYGILGGFGSVYLMYTAIIILGVYFDKKLSIASGLAFAGGSCGQLILPQIIRLLLNAYGFRGTMLVLGALQFNPLVAAMLFRPPSFYQRKKKDKTNKDSRKINRNTIDLIQIKALDEINESEKDKSTCKALLEPKDDIKSLTITEDVQRDPSDNEIISKLGISSQSDNDYEKESDVQKQTDNQLLTHDHCAVEDSSAQNEPSKLLFTPNDDPDSTQSKEHKLDLAYNNSIESPSMVSEGLPDPHNYTLKESVNALCCSYKYYLFSAGRCLCIIAMYMLILFIPHLATSYGLTKSQVALMLSVMGASDLPSRPFHGWIVSLSKIDVRYYTGITSILASVIVFCCVFFPSHISIFIMGISMTMLYNPSLCLMNVITIASVGRELFPRAMMFGMMVTYVFLIFLPAVFGKLYDSQGSYTIPVIICSVCGIIGGILTMVEKTISSKKRIGTT